MNRPLVYVLVINWNGVQHLQECLDSLIAVTYPNVRFLFIDNASTDGSVQFVNTHYSADARVEILALDTNLGWAGGNNAGMERALAAGADYVFLLNNDTAVAGDVLDALVDMAERRPQAGALAPRMLMFDCPEILNSIGLECSAIGAAWDRGIGRLDHERWHEERPVLGACGGAAFFKAEALRQTGLLSTDFEIYLDDLDMCLQMWQAGYEVWTCPSAVVRHKFSATTGAGAWARRKYFLNTRNRILLMLRNFPVIWLPYAFLLYGLGECRALARAALCREWWRAMAHVRSWTSIFSYMPAALRERWRRQGWTGNPFWPLVIKTKMFFEGTEFPVHGWYEPRVINGVSIQPISARAWRDVPPGRLRVSHMNCYPRLGATAIDVLLNGRHIGRLETVSAGEQAFETEGGLLEFICDRLFLAEQTGERMDLGGWLHVEVL